MSAALVIQGPLVSVGRSGAEPTDATASLAIDTLDALRCQIDEARRVGFDEVIVSTWAHEERAANIGNEAQVVVVNDPGPGPVDNRERQATGCLAGAEATTADFVARVRADQQMDLAALRQALDRAETGELHLLGIRRDRPVHLTDFVVAGTRDDVVGHYRAQAAFGHLHFHDFVHFDLFWKDAYAHRPDGVDRGVFVPATSYVIDQQQPVFEMMFGQRLRPLPASVVQSVVWRGARFDDSYINRTWLTAEEWSPARTVARCLAARSVRLTPLTRGALVDPRAKMIGAQIGRSRRVARLAVKAVRPDRW